jgi:DNA-binding Lrp family transcriptional regulator
MAFAPLDRINCEIIRLLQQNARLSNKQVAAAVHLAPSSCHQRIKNLEEAGVIRGAHAEIDSRAIGLNLEALAFIKLAKYERGVIERFMNRIASISEVRQVFLVSGRHDVIVHVIVKDIDHLRNLGFDRFTNQPELVSIETAIVYESRSKNELPILVDDTEMHDKNPAKRSARRRSRRR